MEPLVSIICTVYNHEPFLRDCLNGFVMQKTDFPFEVLIHEDASTDRSADIIREYKRLYPEIIHPIYQTENQYSKGVRIWANIMFPKAKGKYIALCEGDDYWTDPHKLQKQVDYMESHPDCSLCFHNAIIHFEDNTMEDCPFASIEDRDYSGEELIGRLITQTATFLFRSVIAEKWSDYYIKKMCFADTPLVLLCAKLGTVHGLSECMSIYRRHTNSWTATYSSIKIYQIGRTWENVRNALAGSFYSSLTKLMTDAYMQALSHAYREERNYCIAVKSLYRGVLLHPKIGFRALLNNAKKREVRLKNNR